MRKMLSIAALALTVAMGAVPAASQDGSNQGGYEEQGGLPPSAAVKRAVAAYPGAKPLGVKRRGAIYVVRLRQDGTIIQVGVDPATGDVFPLQ
jgi:hypothetical protein